ncbi:MAG: leucine-rich repeat protein, partial [Clostridia bacterium]|nr:leucine-rich repeat protein [Clostridia bacterium]
MKKGFWKLFAAVILIAVMAVSLTMYGCAKEGCENGIHDYTVDNLCSKCGDVWEYTEGLGYVEYGEGYQFQYIPYDMTVKDLVLPYGYNGRPVVFIHNEACKENTDLESVTIPGSVRLIDSNAFFNCYNLSEITLPDTPIEIW